MELTSPKNPILENFDEESSHTISGWSEDIEILLSNIRDTSAIMARDHKKKYIKLKGQLIYYRVPLIMIGSINSVFAVGLNTYIEQDIVSTINCLLSLICAMITSVELFLQIQKRSEIELVSYQKFYLLSMQISNTLKLKPQHRQEKDGRMYLSNIEADYESLFNMSNINKYLDDDDLVSIKRI